MLMTIEFILEWIPRTNRCILLLMNFDLQARIQVALFNILQRNIQIRGF
jgi:hypothetical protein